jgi:hypothetical protein
MEEIDTQLFTDEYNVARYLDAFNKKVKPLLVCFDPEIRSNILLDIVKVKDKDTKKVTEKLKERQIFTKKECDLVSGMPFKEADQDSYEDLMRMEDKEIKFWDKVNKIPNNMEESEWNELRVDYHERMRIAKIDGIIYEKEVLEDVLKHLEVKDLKAAMQGELPADIFVLCDIANDDSWALISRKWGEPLCYFNDIFKYEEHANKRDVYYKMVGKENDDNKYEEWLDYLAECKVMTGETMVAEFETIVNTENMDIVLDRVKEKSAKVVIEQPVEVKKKRVMSEGDEDEDEIEEDEDGNIIRNDENLLLDDEFDDTFGEVPDGYVISEPVVTVAEIIIEETKIVESRLEGQEGTNGPDDSTLNEVEAPRNEAVLEEEDEWGF